MWIVPLFSWYSTPEEDPEHSLYANLSGEASHEASMLWMDKQMCRWPIKSKKGNTFITKSQYFTSLNEDAVDKTYDSKVITFSHMLPRQDLMVPDGHDKLQVNKERGIRGTLTHTVQGHKNTGFNFTKYAGCKRIEEQLRKVASVVHVYGHQHRNRDRVLENVRYVSHCLGSVREQKEGWVYGLQYWKGPKQIWPLIS